MAITKEKKKALIGELDTLLGASDSLVFVSFNKLTVKDANELRRMLLAVNVGYKVAKKTLLKRSLANKKVEGTLADLPGEIGVAFLKGGADITAPAREVYSFLKAHKDVVRIVGGIFEGVYKDEAAMMSIATIPPREVMYAQFVQLINSPISRFAIALNQIAAAKAA